MIKTPPNQGIFILLLNCAWFGSEVGIVKFFEITFNRGDYSPNSDSICIPIMGWACLLVLLAPVVNLLAISLLRGAKFPAPLFIANNRHPHGKKFTLLACAISIVVLIFPIGVFSDVPQYSYCEFPCALLAIYLAFSIRAAQMNRDAE